MRAGIVLAGGRSSRMGTPKALVEVYGVTMIERVRRGLEAVCDEVLVVGGEPTWAPQALFVADPLHSGPLGGLAIGLEATEADIGVVVGCDQPFLDPAALRGLLDAIGDADAAVSVDANGIDQPLHGVYRARCAGVARDLLASGERRVRVLLERLDVVRVPCAGRSCLSVDTPADLASIERGSG